MIKSLKITNFCSIGETQTISFEISKKDKLDDSSAKISNKYINLVNCFIGHNASGKTTILKAISFLFWLINNSYTSTKMDEFIPVVAHKFFKDKTTKIEMEFYSQKKLFLYKLAVDKHYIKNEFLGENVERAYTKIFEYTRTESGWDFSAPKVNINENDLLRFKERKNVSVLSSLIETGYLPQIVFIKNFKSNVTSMGHFLQHPLNVFFEVSNALFVNKETQKNSLDFMRDIDVGISNFSFSEAIIRNGKNVDETEKKYLLECVHKSEAGEFKLPLIEESNGTIHSLELWSKITSTLKTGGVVILDEIESGLHPYVVKKIVSFFENTESNPHGAQLIFSTHQHLLLNDRAKTQIFIVEKINEKFETELFRLDEVEGIRNDDNYFNKYLAGTYGGIPHVNWVKK